MPARQAMNEQQQQAYLNLIQQLLNCPQGEEENILQANAELVDGGLVQVMEQVATMMEQQGEGNPAWLRNLATGLSQYLNQSQRSLNVEDYTAFLQEVLQAIWESNNDPQVVYPVLQQHQNKLDDNFAQILQQWAIKAFKEGDSEQVATLAGVIGNFCIDIYHFPLGNRATNLEIAITGYKTLLEVMTRSTMPMQWAITMTNLANAYSDRIRGEKAENLEEAIATHRKALEVMTPEAMPLEWAQAMNDLGSAYAERICGEKAENIEQAIDACKQALEVRTREAMPVQWAQTMQSLGDAYYARIRGEKAENLEQAITAYKHALEVRTRESMPVQWAQTMNNLAIAYRQRIQGEKAENIEQANAAYRQVEEVRTQYLQPSQSPTSSKDYLAFLQEVLQAEWQSHFNPTVVYPLLQRHQNKLDENFVQILQQWTKNVFSQGNPEEMATVAEMIGNLCIHLHEFPRGNRAKNLEIAIAGYKTVLEVYTREAFPPAWAMIQVNLGLAYRDRIRGSKAENLEQAIEAYQQALSVYTLEAFPKDWAGTQNNLGDAYSIRIKENRAENLEKAIETYQQALQVFTLEAFPVEWAMTQHNLGTAYRHRVRRNKAENLEKAIKAFQRALLVRTLEVFPQDWAATQNNLGTAYRDRIKEDRAQNLEKAIEAYKQALRVRTLEDLPFKWAITQNNLGNVYFQRIKGDRAENLELAIDSCQQALRVFTLEDSPLEWAMTQKNLGNAYRDRIKWDKAENLEAAIACYQEALKVSTHEAFPFDWATTQYNLAIAYRDRIKEDRAENLELAIEACQQALRIFTLEDFPFDWAVAQAILGTIYGRRIKEDRAENLEKSIKACQQALLVYTLEAFPQNWAVAQSNLGTTYLNRIHGEKEKNLETAIACYQGVLLKVFTREAFPKNHAETAFNLGCVYQEKGQFDRAYTTFKSAIETVESLRGEIKSEGESKQKLAEQWHELYIRMVEVCLELGKENEAIEYVERSKARNLVELIATLDLIPKGDIPATILEELNRLRREIFSEQRRLESEQRSRAYQSTMLSRENGFEGYTPATTTLDHIYLRLQQQLNDLIARDISPIDPDFSITQKVEPISFSQIQALAEEKTAILEWYITGDQILTFIVTSSGRPTVWQSSPEDREDLIEVISSYLSLYNEYRQKINEKWQTQLSSLLQRFAEVLHINEIISSLPAECDLLILIPHRFLHILPLHTLPVTLNTEGARLAPLQDKFPKGVKYAPSCQLLQKVQERQRPDFSRLLGIQTPTKDLYEKDWGVVTAIKKQFTHPQTEIIRKEKATKSAILNSPDKLQAANCLLFFCHGNFNFKSPLDSGLSLANDKLLTLEEIIRKFNLKNCRLVTLSACETGAIDIGNNSDEYIGLPFGFLLAGSTNVVASLWSVDSTATALLMAKFYQELQQPQANITVALKTAQNWLRQTTVAGFREWLPHSELAEVWRINLDIEFEKIEKKKGVTYQPFSSPYYWAAFCTIGKGV